MKKLAIVATGTEFCNADYTILNNGLDRWLTEHSYTLNAREKMIVPYWKYETQMI